MDVLQQKKELRSSLKSQIRALSFDSKFNETEQLISLIKKHPEYIEAKCILSFWPIAIEPQIGKFNIEMAKEKNVLLPKINGNVLSLHPFTEIKDLKPEPKYGILEPQGEVFTQLNSIDLVLVPALGFTKDGLRLGKGKGFYDKLLPLLNAYTLGIGFKLQVLDDIPVTPNDFVIQEVLTA